jgi:hypothetical protein
MRTILEENPEITQEEYDKQMKEYCDWYEDATQPEIISEADEGRRMRDLSEFSEEEFIRIRTATIFGVVGTFVWAFGDLLTKVLAKN